MERLSPRKAKNEDYDGLVRELVLGLSELEQEICFYLYGSYVRGDYRPGVSDIDGGIILEGNYVTNKQLVKKISRIFKEARKKYPIRLQFNLTERGSNKDGRFLSYDKSYTDYIKHEARTLLGNGQWVQELNGLDFKSGTLESLAFGLRKVRNALLNWDYIEEKDEREANELAVNTFNTTIAVPKRIRYIDEGVLYPKKLSSLNWFKETYPGVNLAPLVDIMSLMYSQESLERAMTDRKGLKELLFLAATFYEEVAREYCKKRSLAESYKGIRVFTSEKGL